MEWYHKAFSHLQFWVITKDIYFALFKLKYIRNNLFSIFREIHKLLENFFSCELQSFKMKKYTLNQKGAQ